MEADGVGGFGPGAEEVFTVGGEEAAEEAAEALRPMRTLTGGTVTFGTFSSAHHFLLVELVAARPKRLIVLRPGGVPVAEFVVSEARGLEVQP